MNARTSIFTILIALCTLTGPATAQNPAIAVYFSPNGGCTAAAVAVLDAATASIDVAAYQLTSAPLIDALARASKRGVAVRIVVDRSQESNRSGALEILSRTIRDIRTDRREKIQHNKTAVIDGRVVLAGSFNWTRNAELFNAENLLIITDPATAALYAADFDIHWNHSWPFQAKPRPIEPPKKRVPVFSSLNTRPHTKGF